MKKVFVVLFVLSLSFAIQSKAQTQTDPKKMPIISFTDTVHDFGVIPYGGNGVFEFKFKNKGKEPLILQNVQTSCGCTTPKEWPRDPIKKGGEGSVTILYDTKRVGNFSKTITVISNAKNSPQILIIKGTIEPQK